MIRGTWVSMCLRATAELGLLDHLIEPATTEQLAESCACDTHTVARFLRALTDLELVVSTEDGQYSVTPLGETMRTGHPPSALRELALMQSWLPNVASWHSLADAVRGGTAVFEAVNGASLWEHLSANPEQEATFNAAMARRGEQQAAAILAGCDLSGISTMVDVGGGKGGMLAALLPAQPHLLGMVAERPDVATAAEQAFASLGLAKSYSGGRSGLLRGGAGRRGRVRALQCLA
jgi:hypothetical protein